MVAATSVSRRAETSFCQQAPEGPLAAPLGTPLGRRGRDVPMLSHEPSARESGFKTPPKTHPGSTSASLHQGTPRGMGGRCSLPAQPGSPVSPLKGSEMSSQAPRQQIPGGSWEGLLPSPPLPPSGMRWHPPGRGEAAVLPPAHCPLPADPGGGCSRPPARPSQMARAASAGGPAPRQIGAGCLRRARPGLRPCHPPGTEQSQSPLMHRGCRARGVPTMLCPVLDPVLQHRHHSAVK